MRGIDDEEVLWLSDEPESLWLTPGEEVEEELSGEPLRQVIVGAIQ
nr:hypothetical protein [uncultured Pseudomonas sp.]